jgi:hypothetical protein
VLVAWAYPFSGECGLLPDPTEAEIEIIRRDRFGGLLHEYAQIA